MERYRRADARRNSERIVRAAIAAFRERGRPVSLEDVARRAEVGVATVYRLFGGREGLVRAAFDTYFAEEVEAPALAAREAPDPLRGLTDALTSAVTTLSAHRDLLAAAHEAGAVSIDTVERFLDPLRAVLAAAQDAGTVRADLAGRDLAAIVVMALSTVHPGDPDGADQRRYLALLLSALRPAEDRLPPPAPAPLADKPV